MIFGTARFHMELMETGLRLEHHIVLRLKIFSLKEFNCMGILWAVPRVRARKKWTNFLTQNGQFKKGVGDLVRSGFPLTLTIHPCLWNPFTPACGTAK